MEKTRIPVKSLIKWLWKSSEGTRRQAVVNTAVGLVDVVCQLLWVLACKHAIDVATGDAEGSLLVTGVIIATLMLAEIVSRAASRWMHSVVGVKVRNRMRLKCFSMLLKGDWLHLQKHHTGDLTNRLEGDVKYNNITDDRDDSFHCSGVRAVACVICIAVYNESDACSGNTDNIAFVSCCKSFLYTQDA